MRFESLVRGWAAVLWACVVAHEVLGCSKAEASQIVPKLEDFGFEMGEDGVWRACVGNFFGFRILVIKARTILNPHALNPRR